MRVVNFGSLNIDHVYQVEQFARPGETIAARSYEKFAGGKGLNQSIALARAGARVAHAGKIGHDGTLLVQKLEQAGADCQLIEIGSGATGHAVIQVTAKGENSIVVAGGTNRAIDQSLIDRVLDACTDDSWLLLQNEINGVEAILRAAAKRKMRVVFNPAPVTSDVQKMSLDAVDLLVVNEVEAGQLAGHSEHAKIVESILEKYPEITLVLTLGQRGAIYANAAETLRQDAFDVSPVDTTAAGDTFLGFFLAALIAGQLPQSALRIACQAAALSITRPGAADSIPTMAEVRQALGEPDGR